MENHPNIDPRKAFKEGHMGDFFPAGINGEGVIYDPHPPQPLTDQEIEDLTQID